MSQAFRVCFAFGAVCARPCAWLTQSWALRPPGRSDFESDDDQPKKPVPEWARPKALLQQLVAQVRLGRLAARAGCPPCQAAGHTAHVLPPGAAADPCGP